MQARSLVFALLAALNLSVASADVGPFGVKGVALGADFSSAQALPSIRCNKTVKIEYCIWLRPQNIPDDFKTIGSIQAEMYSFYALDGKVQKIEVAYSALGHEQLKGALSDKFGKPVKAEEHVLQNRMGANFVDEEVLWQSPNGDEMTLRKYARSLETGMLVIRSSIYRSKDASDSSERKQKAISDL
jgi:hypothetical protein